jgi:hypothetical protein
VRAYFFGNMYLSSIQQGIQAAHVIAELFMKYENCLKETIVKDWAVNHKTIILLNGGYASNIQDLINFFTIEDFYYGNPIRVENPDNPYPWAYFCEEEASLNHSLTSVGIILPSCIYNTAADLRENGKLKMPIPFTLNKWELELVERLITYGMAK